VSSSALCGTTAAPAALLLWAPLPLGGCQHLLTRPSPAASCQVVEVVLAGYDSGELKAALTSGQDGFKVGGRVAAGAGRW